jgi:hypothetical protein
MIDQSSFRNDGPSPRQMVPKIGKVLLIRRGGNENERRRNAGACPTTG